MPYSYNFVSCADLSEIIRHHLWHVPHDLDMVVGVPRSGMIPAYLMGLFLNLEVTSLDSFVHNTFEGHGQCRALSKNLASPHQAKKILLVDDSLCSGGSMKVAVEKIKASGYTGQVVTCVPIVKPTMQAAVDLSFAEIPIPRIFEWNLFHHPALEQACLDLDGVMGRDPTNEENDDGPLYNIFLEKAEPLFIPSVKLGHIVSTRLEKYRGQTEKWLARHGIQYGALHLVDLPSGAERRRLKVHAPHKAKAYLETGANLFLESDERQSQQIAELTGKPVICINTMKLYPGKPLA